MTATIVHQLAGIFQSRAESQNKAVSDGQRVQVELSGRENVSEVAPDYQIMVSRVDRGKGPLTVSYSEAHGILRYGCGGGTGQFNLVATDHKDVHFETPYHQRKSLEEIAEQLFTLWNDAPF